MSDMFLLAFYEFDHTLTGHSEWKVQKVHIEKYYITARSILLLNVNNMYTGIKTKSVSNNIFQTV